MTASLSADIFESNVNIANNTSDVTVNLYVNWSAGTWANDSPYGEVVIDGTTYGFTANFNVSQTYNGSQLIASFAKTVTHNFDGSRSVGCSAWFWGNGSAKIYWSGGLTLTTIPRGSVLGAVSAFNWEDSFSVPVTKYSSSFTDNLTIGIGGTSIKSISGYTSGAAISLSDAELLAAYNALGTGMNATASFSLQTYSGATQIGTSNASATGTAAGTAYLNAGGSWKRTVPHLNAGGTWKKCIAYTNIGGVWKRCVG